MNVDVIPVRSDITVSAQGLAWTTERRSYPVYRATLIKSLMEAHAAPHGHRVSVESVPGEHRLRLLQQAHALDPVVHRLWPARCKAVTRWLDERIVTNFDAWRIAAIQVRAEVEAPSGSPRVLEDA